MSFKVKGNCCLQSSTFRVHVHSYFLLFCFGQSCWLFDKHKSRPLGELLWRSSISFLQVVIIILRKKISNSFIALYDELGISADGE